MKAQELRIGNYLNPTGSFFSVISLSPQNILSIDKTNFGLNNNDDYKPIPLTDDWAVKFGYENLVEMASCFKDDSKYSIEVTSEDLDRLFVHEAQNLYFALTNKEL